MVRFVCVTWWNIMLCCDWLVWNSCDWCSLLWVIDPSILLEILFHCLTEVRFCVNYFLTLHNYITWGSQSINNLYFTIPQLKHKDPHQNQYSVRQMITSIVKFLLIIILSDSFLFNHSLPEVVEQAHLKGVSKFRWSHVHENLFATTGCPGNHINVYHMGHHKIPVSCQMRTGGGLSWHPFLPVCASAGGNKVHLWFLEV